MIRRLLLPLVLAAAGLGACVAAPAVAKEKPASEDAAAAKPDRKKSADKKTDADKAHGAKSEGKQKADAKTAEAKPEPKDKTAKDKNGKDKGGKDRGEKDKPEKDKTEKDKGPQPIGAFGDWAAMTAHGHGGDKNGGKTCYALAEPKERLPAKLLRDKAYVYISTRPAESVRNEVAIILGFAAKEGAAATAEVDGASFELVTKGANAWVKNPAKEKEFVEALKSGSKLTVKASSAKGNVTTDLYSLKGLSETLGRVQKECP